MAGLEPDERGAGWNYYNENDRFAAQWLRELIRDELIPNGVVDERTILDVSPAEVRGFAHCHFFAGIAGWSEALRLAASFGGLRATSPTAIVLGGPLRRAATTRTEHRRWRMFRSTLSLGVR